MADFLIEIENHTKETLEKMQDKVSMALGVVGEKAVGYAVKDCPVDTGNLKNSIAWATDKKFGGGDSTPHTLPDFGTLAIGTNVKYAPYVEYGDQKHTVGKKHFLRDSAANHGDFYKAIVKAALDS